MGVKVWLKHRKYSLKMKNMSHCRTFLGAVTKQRVHNSELHTGLYLLLRLGSSWTHSIIICALPSSSLSCCMTHDLVF